MQNWISLTVGDLMDAKASALVSALQTSALGTGQADPTQNILDSVAARVRAEVRGCASNQLDTDPTKIPASLKGVAVRMVLREMESRLQLALTPDEIREEEQDLNLLQRVSQCQVPVEQPLATGADQLQAASVSPLITARMPQFKRENQDGL